ncbi:sigma-70 family RNA polymerase sigma factor [Gordonia sp. SID5947]|uniref:RNA polymerase sigma factor SigJ n=1 Tax=Gordonia sp. SID5947 TaxID=2690315 RepID=UPI00136DC2FF|nr:RNA polymerase sigma factor SigJ [Gordonia sp. SID5947]MYR05232.1 sigma-70 family RNA polymerase sigma factor [Gordonia sp. SID5947]
MSGDSEGEHARRFTELRPLLFTVAYEILGSATDADDVLQESYLRWADVDLGTVDDTKAYLAKVVTRQALNLLRASSRRREQYIGPWLPEPILLDERDAAQDLVLAESVSTAMLVVLETLSPDERVVFVLREVFGFGHDEIAEMIGKSDAAVRQAAHRARAHVQARRRRFVPVDASRTTEITEAFMAAAESGEIETLMTLMSPDVVFTTDSDGKASAVRRPIRGALAVARLLAGFSRVGGHLADFRVEPAIYNSLPGMRIHFDGELQGVLVLDVVDGLVADIYAVRNPEKLTGVGQPRRISR